MIILFITKFICVSTDISAHMHWIQWNKIQQKYNYLKHFLLNCLKLIYFLRYLGENFVRLSGDTINHAKAQLFAWEAHEKGVDVHLLAEPTKLELLRKEYDKKKKQIKNNIKNDVLERYGGEEHLQVPPKTLLLAQTEDYVEYSRSGRLIKGAEKQIIRSKYEEDVYINNHTSVWGSFWKDGQWGYKCCYSFIKVRWTMYFQFRLVNLEFNCKLKCCCWKMKVVNICKLVD